jgi:hypothetical protein
MANLVAVAAEGDLRAGVARLAELRTAGLVRHASEPVGGVVEQSLPVSAQLRPLLPGGTLRRGSTVAVAAPPGPIVTPGRPSKPGPLTRSGQSTLSGQSGATSLLFALLAEASAAGSWCAAVGLPQLGLVAAGEAGVAVERLALVPHPGPDWTGVVAALLDGVDIVAVATPGPVAAQVASRLMARARQRGTILVPVGQWSWPGVDLTLEVVGSAWHGLGQGRGRLRTRELEVLSHGRGAAARPRRTRLWLSDDGSAPAPTVLPTLAPALDLAG